MCAVETLHGEPAATFACVAFVASGVLTSTTVVTLGSSTEALSAEAVREGVAARRERGEEPGGARL